MNQFNALDEARRKLLDLMTPHLMESGCLPESDLDINNASREIISAMRQVHGEAWIGNINLHKRHRGEPEQVMWKWDGKLVCNFEVAFVLPKHDPELERLIEERFASPYNGTLADCVKIDAIHDRLKEIGGVHLSWT